jgi:hypothetical protein
MKTFLEAFAKPHLCRRGALQGQFQPVDPSEGATRLGEVVTSEPAACLPDCGGREVRDFKTIAESWRKARKLNRKLVPLHLPTKLSRQFALGVLVTLDHRDSQITFEHYRAEKYPE